ncbi:hypothetical protein SYNTR_1534 [Candidatus Syntrophocurvum alkaliphilum]|uniref:LysM domain-containing protein n=1 Tax=Candidatus Syntrophocurvum alkaliphilum TaxID=2293317 RepID=A0A6I6DGL4_9FIRM|nr:peptidoglycan-binding protein [Candidatus Syntrophocurvum alkaliphilum]QGU00128.1 hypothetical protein SYNTR_1534 [Candidatus Syntrophocurvum alkaliphilum]
MNKNQFTPNYYYFGSRKLKLEFPFMKGNDIKILQSLLGLMPNFIVSTKIMTNGLFDTNTHKAVKEFQKYFKLKSDGIVGVNTYYALGHRIKKFSRNEPVFSSQLLKEASSGADVSILQNRLAAFRKTYLNRPATGKFNVNTKLAVKRFQHDFPDLTPDGIVGPETFNKIFLWAPLGGRILHQGRNGLDTYWLQLYLFYLRYFKQNPNGFFNAYTAKSIEKFQADANIKVDSVVGPQTYLALGTSIAFPQNEYFYMVKKDDSLFKIASLFDKKKEEIIKLNNLNPSDCTIHLGQLLLIPPPITFHVVKKGETLGTISKKYSISIENLELANYFSPKIFLLPDELLVLPGYHHKFKGKLVYIQVNNMLSELRVFNLEKMQYKTLDFIKNLKTPQLFLSKDRKKLSVIISRDGIDYIRNYDIHTGAYNEIKAPIDIEYLDWSYDSKSLVINKAMIINTKTGQELFNFKGEMPQWFTDNKNILYYRDNAFRKINYQTNVVRHVCTSLDKSIWFSRLKTNDNNKFFYFAFLPSRRVTCTFIYDYKKRLVKNISRNDYFGTWSRTLNYLILSGRDYYGNFFPWFYMNIKLFNQEGKFLNNQLFAKGIDLNDNNFDINDTSFLAVLYNPSKFYSIPVISRDIYLKDIQTQLLTKLTLSKNAYNPIFL